MDLVTSRIVMHKLLYKGMVLLDSGDISGGRVDNSHWAIYPIE